MEGWKYVESVGVFLQAENKGETDFQLWEEKKSCFGESRGQQVECDGKNRLASCPMTEQGKQ